MIMTPAPIRKTRYTKKSRRDVARKQWIAYFIILAVLISAIIAIALAGQR